jgi:SAM-dependent methyltransferase
LNGVTAPAVFVASSAHDVALPDQSVDVVVGIAILHHLDLRLVTREVERILKPGGCAIFKEPVRESRTLKFIRGLIPYRAPDVSPFERPLTETELREFADEFTSYKSRAFSLPFVNLTAVVPFLKKWIFGAYRLDGAILRRAPFLKHLASVRVIELTK